MAELTASQRITNQVFSKGSLVEVSLDQPQFRKSGYTATVLRLYTKKVQVKFENLSDPQSNKPLIGFVDLERARPIPPPDHPGQRYLEGMKVDVKEDGGWWEGFIFTVHNSINIFTIFMKSSYTLRQFSRSELRIHKVWEDGRWVLPEQHHSVFPSIDFQESTTGETPEKDECEDED